MEANSQTARLIGLYGAYKGNEYPLTKDEFIIGRSQECDLKCDENTISAQHAKITRKGNQYQVEDLGSTNGTFVNDTRIDKKVLRTDDRVKFDIFVFRFINPADVSRTVISSSPDFLKMQETVIRSESKTDQTQVAPLPSEKTNDAPPPDQKKPLTETISFRKRGHPLPGLILGLLVSLLVGLGGTLAIAWAHADVALSQILSFLPNWYRTFPLFHLHPVWLHTPITPAGIGTVVCWVLAPVLGAFIFQNLGRKKRLLTALWFGLIYAILFIPGQLLPGTGAVDVTGTLGLGLASPLLNQVAGFGYFFVVVLVLSTIGARSGKK